MARADPSVLTPNFFNKVQARCFDAMYHNVFLPFKATADYKAMTANTAAAFNSNHRPVCCGIGILFCRIYECYVTG